MSARDIPPTALQVFALLFALSWLAWGGGIPSCHGRGSTPSCPGQRVPHPVRAEGWGTPSCPGWGVPHPILVGIPIRSWPVVPLFWGALYQDWGTAPTWDWGTPPGTGLPPDWDRGTPYWGLEYPQLGLGYPPPSTTWNQRKYYGMEMVLFPILRMRAVIKYMGMRFIFVHLISLSKFCE